MFINLFQFFFKNTDFEISFDFEELSYWITAYFLFLYCWIEEFLFRLSWIVLRSCVPQLKVAMIFSLFNLLDWFIGSIASIFQSSFYVTIKF